MDLLLKNQGSVDCCAPIACLHALEFLAISAGKRYVFSHLYVYYMARKLQGTLPLGKCRISSVLLALEKYGACSEEIWPFDRNRINIEPTDDAVFNGLRCRLRTVECVNNVHTYLQRNIPVIIGFSIGELFTKLPNEYIPINGTTNCGVGGHAAVIVGSTARGWIIANSYGVAWGNKGYSILPYECDIDIGEKYAITSFSEITF